MNIWTSSNTQSSPVTHALVIGIGEYPFCGPGATAKGANKINDLSSPSHSAYAIAKSLIDNADKFHAELGSVTLLAEDLQQHGWTPTLPTFANVRKAFRAWQANGKHADCLLLYWCGHGFEFDRDQLLVCRDTGKDGDFWDYVVNISADYYTAHTSKPKTQLWCIDACRDAAEDLKIFNPNARTLLPDTNVSSITNSGHKDMTFIQASGAFRKAAGLSRKPSFFSAAFIDCLKWAAWNKVHQQWQVRTSDFVQPINRIFAEREYEGSCDAQTVIGQHPILSSALGPEIPASFRCDPKTAQPRVKLSLLDIQRMSVSSQSRPSLSAWQLNVTGGLFYLQGQSVDDEDDSKETPIWIQPSSREGILPW